MTLNTRFLFLMEAFIYVLIREVMQSLTSNPTLSDPIEPPLIGDGIKGPIQASGQNAKPLTL